MAGPLDGLASFRWWKAQVPVTRRGEILPRSGMYFFRMSAVLVVDELDVPLAEAAELLLGGKNFL